MKTRIKNVGALEILDSRGYPTIRVLLELNNGRVVTASVPSGASTGMREAIELRDGNVKRYSGKGVLNAVKHVNETIAPRLVGLDPSSQSDIDLLLKEIDGTKTKSKLGANAILGVSMAVARAGSEVMGLSLHAYLAGSHAVGLPVPMMNVLNGGMHADNNVDFQEFMVMPIGAPTYAEALRYGVETFHALKRLLKAKGYPTAVGDEGGFAPNLRNNEEACELIVEAIGDAGYTAGKDVAIALDPAATSFCHGASYNLSKSRGGIKTSAELTALYEEWVNRYPIVSIEDGLDETDWEGFRQLTARLGDRIQIVGDDVYVTNPILIERGIKERTTNAVLIKLNQIGTVTEAIEAVTLCRNAGWKYIVSHRSGETEDTFIADFAVAMGGGQIKAGSGCRSERIAKYNRLLEIEAELGPDERFLNPFQDPDQAPELSGH